MRRTCSSVKRVASRVVSMLNDGDNREVGVIISPAKWNLSMDQ